MKQLFLGILSFFKHTVKLACRKGVHVIKLLRVWRCKECSYRDSALCPKKLDHCEPDRKSVMEVDNNVQN
jgi:hypothetical protein